MMDKEELKIDRINECGRMIDQFLTFYDQLIKRKFEKTQAADIAERVIEKFMLYKAGLVIDEIINEEEEEV